MRAARIVNKTIGSNENCIGSFCLMHFWKTVVVNPQLVLLVFFDYTYIGASHAKVFPFFADNYK